MNPLRYAITIFCSAFLLFQVEPIVAKIILPWFGGSAAVWTTCLLFFQVALLLGYAYAHLLIRNSAARWHVNLHLGLLACSVLLLPVIPSAAWKPTGAEEPTLRILTLLTATVGLPYFLLSATSPLLQAWYTRQQGGVVPYWLFALSNVGSMLALVSYPLVVEPAIEIRTQALVWSVGYAGFVLLCGSLAWASRTTSIGAQSPQRTTGGPARKCQLLWLALTACASTLLLAISNHLTQNVAAIPLLWVLPLALYLLSFILCFADLGFYKRWLWLPLTAAALAGMAYLRTGERQMLSPVVSLPLYLGGLFCCCMAMHGELVRFRPNPRYLTSFYLMSSLGGAIGGVFVGVLAPHLFRQYSELPIAMVWCAFLVYVVLELDPPRYPKRYLKDLVWLTTLAGAIVLAFYVAPRAASASQRFAARNFYGVLEVSDSVSQPDGHRVRTLKNGIVNHGNQILDAGMRQHPTTYYGPGTGIGLALRESEGISGRRVGIVGLGTGTIAAYGRPGDSFRFYEINPMVLSLAQTEFTYLKDSKAAISIVLGDGRLSLEREPNQNFDILIVDAFTSDAIPVHLLTREAFGIYARHLKPEGVLAVHVSNEHLDLAPVVKMAADSLGRQCRVINSAGVPREQVFGASWMLVSSRRPASASPVAPPTHLRPWTDGYSNLWEILR